MALISASDLPARLMPGRAVCQSLLYSLPRLSLSSGQRQSFSLSSSSRSSSASPPSSFPPPDAYLSSSRLSSSVSPSLSSSSAPMSPPVPCCSRSSPSKGEARIFAVSPRRRLRSLSFLSFVFLSLFFLSTSFAPTLAAAALSGRGARTKPPREDAALDLSVPLSRWIEEVAARASEGRRLHAVDRDREKSYAGEEASEEKVRSPPRVSLSAPSEQRPHSLKTDAVVAHPSLSPSWSCLPDAASPSSSAPSSSDSPLDALLPSSESLALVAPPELPPPVVNIDPDRRVSSLHLFPESFTKDKDPNVSPPSPPSPPPSPPPASAPPSSPVSPWTAFLQRHCGVERGKRGPRSEKSFFSEFWETAAVPALTLSKNWFSSVFKHLREKSHVVALLSAITRVYVHQQSEALRSAFADTEVTTEPRMSEGREIPSASSSTVSRSSQLLPCFSEPFACRRPVPWSLVGAIARYFLVSLFSFLLLLLLPFLLLRLVRPLLSAALPAESSEEACFSMLSSSTPSSPCFHAPSLLFPVSPVHSDASSVSDGSPASRVSAASSHYARLLLRCPSTLSSASSAQTAASKSLLFLALVGIFAALFTVSSWAVSDQIDASLCAIAQAVDAFGREAAESAFSPQTKAHAAHEQKPTELALRNLRTQARTDAREEGEEGEEGRKEEEEGRKEGEEGRKETVEQAFLEGKGGAETRLPRTSEGGENAEASREFAGIAGLSRQLDALALAWASAASAYSEFFSDNDDTRSLAGGRDGVGSRRGIRSFHGEERSVQTSQAATESSQETGNGGGEEDSKEQRKREARERRRWRLPWREDGENETRRGKERLPSFGVSEEANRRQNGMGETRFESEEILRGLSSAVELAVELETRWASRQRLLSLDCVPARNDEREACSGLLSGGKSPNRKGFWATKWRRCLGRLRTLCASAWTCFRSSYHERAKTLQTPEECFSAGTESREQSLRDARERGEKGSLVEPVASEAFSSKPRVRRCSLRPHAPSESPQESGRVRERGDLCETWRRPGETVGSFSREAEARSKLENALDASRSLVSLLRDSRGLGPASPAELKEDEKVESDRRITDREGRLLRHRGVLRCTDAGRRRRLATFSRQLLVYVQEEERALRAFVETQFSPAGRAEATAAIATAQERLTVGIAAVELPLLWRHLEWTLSQFHAVVTGLLRLSRLAFFLGTLCAALLAFVIVAIFLWRKAQPFRASEGARDTSTREAFLLSFLPIFFQFAGCCCALAVSLLLLSSAVSLDFVLLQLPDEAVTESQTPSAWIKTPQGLSSLLAFVPNAAPLSPALFRESLSHCLWLPVESLEPAPVSFLLAERQKLRDLVYQALPASIRTLFGENLEEATQVAFADWWQRADENRGGSVPPGRSRREEEERETATRREADDGERRTRSSGAFANGDMQGPDDRDAVSFLDRGENADLISGVFSAAAWQGEQLARSIEINKEPRNSATRRTDFFAPWRTLPLGVVSKFANVLDRAASSLTKHLKEEVVIRGEGYSGGVRRRRRDTARVSATQRLSQSEPVPLESPEGSCYPSEREKKDATRKINLLFARVIEAAAQSDGGGRAFIQALEGLRGDGDGSEWEIIHLWPPLTSTSLLHTSPTDGVNARLPRLLQEVTGDAWAFRGAALPPACADAPVGPLHFPSFEAPAAHQAEGRDREGEGEQPMRKKRQLSAASSERSDGSAWEAGDWWGMQGMPGEKKQKDSWQEGGGEGESGAWNGMVRMEGQPKRCFYVSQDITPELLVSHFGQALPERQLERLLLLFDSAREIDRGLQFIRRVHAADAPLLKALSTTPDILRAFEGLRRRVREAVNRIDEEERHLLQKSDCRFMADATAAAESHTRAFWGFLFFGCACSLLLVTAALFILVKIHFQRCQEEQLLQQVRRHEQQEAAVLLQHHLPTGGLTGGRA
ncbi:putative transmembrane protein [Toxoplasma gondii p89]|uniref:Putative transmembrane protein n=1 Tax=Toxoplasma gondii p89 TaxID=943119 RepID=A0A086JBX4_TOXGO|nr:putative transmembrane protein [Toxoplasma gondii p89]